VVGFPYAASRSISSSKLATDGVTTGEQTGDVALDRGDAHAEFGGDLGVGASASQREGHVAFPVGQGLQTRACLGAA
jgi:hypothetical protein